MMSWHPRTMDRKLEIAGAPGPLALRGEDVEAEWQLELDGGLPELVVDRRVVVLHRGDPRHHHAPQTQVLDRAQVPDAFLRRPHRRLPATEEAVRVVRAVLGDPSVVGVEARLLHVEVVDVAQHHADGRVDDFGRDPVGVLLGDASGGVPPAPVQLLETRALGADLRRILAGRGDQPHRDRHGRALDLEDVAQLLTTIDEAGRSVAPTRIDVVGVGVRCLGDVRVGRDDRVVDLHGRSPSDRSTTAWHSSVPGSMPHAGARGKSHLTLDGDTPILGAVGTTGRAALFFGPGKPMELTELPVPEPEPGAVVVRVTRANICGSDLHIWRGDGYLSAMARDDGRIIGHEMTGVVHALGPGVTTDWAGTPLPRATGSPISTSRPAAGAGPAPGAGAKPAGGRSRCSRASPASSPTFGARTPTTST